MSDESPQADKTPDEPSGSGAPAGHEHDTSSEGFPPPTPPVRSADRTEGTDESPDEDSDEENTAECESVELEERERSRSGYQVGSGRDTAFGNIYHYNYASRSREVVQHGSLPPARLTESARVYCAPSSDTDATGALIAQRLVVLHGLEDSGRRSTAVHALDQATGVHRAESRVSVLSPSTRPKNLFAGDLPSEHGWLLDATRCVWPHEVDESELSGLLDRLSEQDGYLVVLVDDQTLAHTLQPYLCAHRAPSARAVLEAHLAARRDYPRAWLARACEDPAVADWLEHLTTPSEAADLADAIAEWADRGGRDPGPDAERRRYQRLSRAALELLRDDGTPENPGRQAFALAGAVLNGESWSRVSEAGGTLALRLCEEQGSGEPVSRKAFADPVPGLVRHLHERDERFSLRDPSLTGALLDVLQSRYEVARRCVVRWLMDLGTSADPVYRVRSAQALARCAGHDFVRIRHEVLDAWAEQNRRGVHLTAAWVLEAAYADNDCREEVRDLLRDWARAGQWQRRAIAVRAYGTRIGADIPDEALRGIGEAARGRSKSYASLVGHAFTELYTLGLCAQVMETLRDWSHDTSVLRDLAAEATVRICRTPDGDGPPDLLVRLADPDRKSPVTVAELAALWRIALPPSSDPADRRAKSTAAAWRGLRDWLKAAATHPRLTATCDALLTELATDRDLHRRIEQHRHIWRHQDSRKNSR